MFAMFLTDNPTYVIELGSYTSANEKNPVMLATKRAELIKTELVKLGIETERILIRAYGNEKPIVPDADISKMKTTKEKEIAYQKNRRVIVNTIANDFQSKKPAPAIPVKTSDDDGE